MNPQGISIHVAVPRGDMKRYTFMETLVSPADNAKAMQRIAEQAGFQTQTLVGHEATCAAVTGAIREAAGPVGCDGILLLTYSGHGDVVSGAPGVDEVEDQCWCLYDGQLVDDELYRLWAEFEPGARIVVISDSCHGGTMIRTGEPGYVPPPSRPPRMRNGGQLRDGSPAFSPPGSGSRQAGQASAAGDEPEVSASVLLLAAAGNRQRALEHRGRSLFSAALLEAWQDGAFQGSYLDLHAELVRLLKGKPRPHYYSCGRKRRGFEEQRPFTIAPPTG